ncbi:MAG TPA: hypothetical protein VMM60_17540 [Ilumatobacter sp.]|nr:hypothetical protein [Ilumatobacter sp.]
MNRPLPRRLVPLALAVAAMSALSACATFTDDNVVARVGDTELSHDDLAAILRSVEGDDAVFAPMNDDNRTDDATDLVRDWITDRLLRDDLTAAGIQIDAPSPDLTGETIAANVDASIAAWTPQPTFDISNDEVRDLYNQGVEESNMLCVSTIIVINGAYAEGLATGVRPDEATAAAAAPAALDFANELRDQIVSGEQTFEQVAEQYASGQRADVAVEQAPCMSGSDFVVNYSDSQPEYVAAVLDAPIGEVPAAAVAPYGVHLIWVHPYDELAPGALDQVLSAPLTRFDFLSRRSDVYLDPRFGVFDGPNFIVPLG